MFNVVSVACAPYPRLFSHQRDIKYSAPPLADVSTSSKGRAFIVLDDKILVTGKSYASSMDNN